MSAQANGDMLDMAFINSLPQPLWAYLSGTWWPVNDIEVQTGLYRIDVCGLLQVEHIGGTMKFRDDSGTEHDSDDFYMDAERASTNPNKEAPTP